jgi:HD superfamily phosphodiesterase
LVERFAPGGIDLFRAFGIPGTSRISDINKSDGAMTFDDPAACLKCITENAHPPAVGAGRQSPLFESAWSHADKLDGIGAVGVARAFLFAGEVGARLHNPGANPEDTLPYTQDDTGYREFRIKLSRVRERILTAEGRRLAAERHAFMEAFFKRFLEEYDGMR